MASVRVSSDAQAGNAIILKEVEYWQSAVVDSVCFGTLSFFPTCLTHLNTYLFEPHKEVLEDQYFQEWFSLLFLLKYVLWVFWVWGFFFSLPLLLKSLLNQVLPGTVWGFRIITEFNYGILVLQLLLIPPIILLLINLEMFLFTSLLN